ncbi:MAG TPA: MarR family transcriptional regulator [Thermoplasmata archaeon]|nr:MarR family transcriptional regulator [Thermoplasmata archaeon]
MISSVPKVTTRPEAIEVASLIDLVHDVLQGSLRQVHPTLAKEGITMGQFWAIHTVSSLEAASLSTVARYLGVSSPSACANIDQLEAAGLVRRRRSEQDRRTVELSLTPQGRKVETRVWREIGRVMAEAGRGLDPNDLAAAVRVFREIAHELESNGTADRGVS